MSASTAVGISDSASYSSTSPRRPILPLPRRRLRSRLSEDANAALFPDPPSNSTPLFYYPFDYPNSSFEIPVDGFPGHMDGQDSDDDDEDNSNASISRDIGPDAPGSAGSGAGLAEYEWTENTKNNKKRKIPSTTGSGGSGGGMSGSYAAASNSSPAYSPTVTPRSRWRSSVSSQRSPLTSINSTNHSTLRRASRKYTPSSPGADLLSGGARSSFSDESGTPSKAPRHNPDEDHYQEVGLPQAPFTFTYESPISANLSSALPPVNTTNPASPSTGAGSGGDAKPVATVGTQTSPNMNSNPAYPSPTPAPAKKTKPKRSQRDILAIQQARRAREARLNQHSNDVHWICEFCEYESIFGERPEALIRQYEIRDREERKRLAEKRRLLEKAKQKNRNKKNSNKKGGGGGGGGNTAAAAVPPAPPNSTADSVSGGSQATVENTPVPSTVPTPVPKERRSREVQTEVEGSRHVSAGRGAGVNGVVKGGGQGVATSGMNGEGGAA